MARNKFFNQVSGYSPLDEVDKKKKLIEVSNCKQIIDAHYIVDSHDCLLVAGTGNGDEARFVAEVFKTNTFGVDIGQELSYQAGANEKLLLARQDLLCLGFQDNTFSMIYCYHVLEHVMDYEGALKELHRVLKSGGTLFIGFPNKNRLFSYFGTSQKATIVEKIKWNLTDYWMRIIGKFENNKGAHAGFTQREFIQSSSIIFKSILPKRNEYMLIKYAHHKNIIQSIINLKLSEIIFPSNYFICLK